MIMRLCFLLALLAGGITLAVYMFAGRKDRLPVLGEPGHTAGAFSFTNQDGRTITEDSVRGKVSVVEYFFTSCPAICPRMNQNLLTIYDNLKSKPGFVILSHTSDPETDSVATLNAYAKRLGVAGPGWQFLTGKKEDLYASASREYLLSAIDTGSSAFIHTEYVALLDRQRRIRGFYDMTKKENAEKMESDILYLLKQ